MTTRHNISYANEIYVGKAGRPGLRGSRRRQGARLHPIERYLLGTPAIGDLDLIVDAATGAELPNAETVVYTTANDGSSPFDNSPTPVPASVVMADGRSYSVWSLDVPRALVATVAHGSSIVAMTVTVDGFDYYGYPMTELFTVTATGTSKTVNGLKAFAHIYRISITAAGNAEANTLDLGSGDVLGLRFRAANKEDVRVFFDGAIDAAVVVAGDDTTPTNATGDVRGTVNPNGTLDGAKRVFIEQYVDDPSSDNALQGVAQYANF